MFNQDRYGYGPASGKLTHQTPTSREVPAEIGLVVEDVETGWVGAITRTEKSGGRYVVELEDRRGKRRTFPLGGGFWIDGAPVTLTVPRPKVKTAGPGRTASGSRAVSHARAQVARGGRIWVEGRHDAELVERIWGDDLRYVGVVVEMLDGVDHLAERLREFDPAPQRPVGVLVDHLVPGSKESRIAASIMAEFDHVLVLGHPYIDVWQAIKPARLGLSEWPQIPRGTDIKVGTLRAFGWPADTQADIARAWKRILGQVRTFHDLEPALIGRVEELVDFVTAEDHG